MRGDGNVIVQNAAQGAKRVQLGARSSSSRRTTHTHSSRTATKPSSRNC